MSAVELRKNDNLKSPLSLVPITNGLLFDCTKSYYPSRMFGHTQGKSSFSEISSFYYGFVVDGEVSVTADGHKHPFLIGPGCYFGSSGKLTVEGNGTVAVIERLGYRGLTTIGGPVESEGRLLYIDHARTSLLIPPARKGDPCFNLLTFPVNTKQTSHTHPTIRLGLVFSGQGQCLEPNQPAKSLHKGLAFLIREGTVHSFSTEQETLSVIAYHPDTDWGPTDESHPMLNRTYRQI